MTDTPQKTPEEIIREQVQARVEEEGTAATATPDPPEISHAMVERCLYANELGDGLLFSALYQDRHAYVGQAGEWIYWDGHHWRFDDMDKAHRARADVEGVVELYEKARYHLNSKKKEVEESPEAGEAEKTSKGKDIQEKIDRLNQRIFKLRSEHGRLRCLDFAKTNRDAPLTVRGDEIDREPWLLPFKNGVVDLKTGQLHPGRPRDYLVRASPVTWQGLEAPCPTWERFMLEVMENDQDMVDFMQRLFGYGITGSSSEHIFVVLFGKGRNGKGIMTELIQEALGGADSFSSLAGPVQSEMLLDQGKNRNSAGPSPDIMGLRGLRMAFASETDEGQRFSPARVKWLSGGETLTGRYPHDKRNIPFQPTHLLFLLTNHKPHASATDFAFWERLLLVKFPLSFVDRKPQTPTERPVDKTLKERLRAELPGIAAWLVRGCLLWQQRGIDPPPKVRDETAEYRKEEDTLGDFLEDCCDIALQEPDSIRTQSTDLYDVFMWWYRANISEKREFSQKAFGRQMKERFKHERKGGKYFYYGVSIKPEAKEQMEESDKPKPSGDYRPSL